MVNIVTAIGNLTKDVLIKQTQNGKAFATFTLATSTSAKNESGEYATIFYNVAAFGKMGENCSTYLKKGSKALVVGDFSVREYKDTEGNARVAYNLTANSVEFLTPKGEDTSPTPVAAPKPEPHAYEDDSFSPF